MHNTLEPVGSPPLGVVWSARDLRHVLALNVFRACIYSHPPLLEWLGIQREWLLPFFATDEALHLALARGAHTARPRA